MVLATLVNFRPSANGNTEFLGGAEFFFFFGGGGGITNNCDHDCSQAARDLYSICTFAS